MKYTGRLFVIIVLVMMATVFSISCQADLPAIPWDLVTAEVTFGDKSSIALGDEVTCQVVIESKSIIDSECEIIIQYDDRTIANHDIALKAEQTESLSFNLKPETYGRHTISVYLSDGHLLCKKGFFVDVTAELTLASGSYIELGDELSCNIDISSPSTIDSQCELVIKYDDTTIATHNIALKVNQTESISFNLQQEDIGEHRIRVCLGDGYSLDQTSFIVCEMFPNQVRIKDIEFIMSEAEKAGIQVQSVVHEGDTMTIDCQADSYSNFREYVTDLEGSERFLYPVIPPEGYPNTTSGMIKLEPKFQRIDVSIIDYLNQFGGPRTNSDAVSSLVQIAEESGIDIDPNASKFLVPPVPVDAASQVKICEWTYKVFSFMDIQIQSDYQNIMTFMSNLGPGKNSGVTLKSLVIKSVSLCQTEQNGEITTTATMSVDIYTKP